MPTTITGNQVSVTGDTVKITGAGGNALANSLIQKNPVTMAELAAQLGFLRPEDISIGTDGTLIIKSTAIADKVNELKSKGGVNPALADTNCSCR